MKRASSIIAPSRISLMWETDRWDEPLKGFLKLDGEKVYFFKRVHHPSEAEEGLISKEDREYSRYDVFELGPEEIKNAIHMHADFQRFVGNHTDAVDGRFRNDPDLVKPLAEHRKFYDKYPPATQNTYENNKYIGSFYMAAGKLIAE